MKNTSIIQKGLLDKLIRFDKEKKSVFYIHQNKKRNYLNPEEKVQVETFLKLVILYNYNPKRITQFVQVKMGRDTKEADIIVYNDDELTEPYILVECKKGEISDLEFNQADHVIPHAKGGRTTLDNSELLCSYHNQSKGAKINENT